MRTADARFLTPNWVLSDIITAQLVLLSHNLVCNNPKPQTCVECFDPAYFYLL